MFTTVPLNAAADLETSVIDLMHADPVRVDGTVPFAEAARLMVVHRVHAILVCDPNGAPLGWMTTRGMVHNAPRDWASASAREAISEPSITVGAEATGRQALEAMLAAGASHILVCDGPRAGVLGVISELDLLGVLTTHITPSR